MAKFYTILTQIGEAKLANAVTLKQQLKLTTMCVGDGGGPSAPEPMPDGTETALRHEVYSAELNSLDNDPENPGQIVAELVLPANVGGWWVREMGLRDEEGDLCAIANCPASYKPILQEGAGRTQTLQMILAVSHTENIELKIDPGVVLATREYTDKEVAKAIADHVAEQNPHEQYAKLAGDEAQGFAVAPATEPHHAVQLAQVITQAGGDIEGNLTIKRSEPRLTFIDTDQPTDAGSFAWESVGKDFRLQRSTDAAVPFQNYNVPLMFDGADVATFLKRPMFGAATPWDSENLSPVTTDTAQNITGTKTFDAEIVSARVFNQNSPDGYAIFNGGPQWSTSSGRVSAVMPNGQVLQFGGMGYGILEGGDGWLYFGASPGGINTPPVYAFRFNTNGHVEILSARLVDSQAGKYYAVQTSTTSRGAAVDFGVISSQAGGLPEPYVVIGLTGGGSATANAIRIYGAPQLNG